MHRLLLFTIPFLASCSVFRSPEFRASRKIEQEVAKSEVFSKSYTGFTLLDPVSGKTLADFNGDKYFIPASTTKILTLATCLELLGDSIPGAQVAEFQTDKIQIYRGTGDPTFLNPHFSDQTVFNKLYQDTTHTLLFLNRPVDPKLGPGWAWDDVSFAYSPERTDWPIYGGLITVYNDSNLGQRYVLPAYFQARFLERTQLEQLENIIKPFTELYYLWPDKQQKDTLRTPIKYAATIGPLLIADTTKAAWNLSIGTQYQGLEKIKQWKTIYSCPIDTVLRRMMYQSDNFIAEQMLLVSAGVKFDTLQQDKMIQWMLDSCLTMLPQRPKWVDGSGLSRYNLMSPQTVSEVLLQLWKTQGKEQLFRLFPAGGTQGTLADWYGGKEGKPYVFAKTGSMSGVQCLSGYLVCKSGKVLIFSFMHNNFIGSGKPWKQEMQRILEKIHDRY